MAVAVLLLCACFAAASIVSWPLLPRAATAWTSARLDGDLSQSLFAHWWAGEVLVGHQPLTRFDLAYFPDGVDMAARLWNLGALAITAWLHLFLEPLAAFNVATLLIMALNGAGCWVLGRQVGGPAGGAVAAAMGVAHPHAWFELFEGHHEQGLLAPAALYLAALLRVRDGVAGAWAWAGLAMALVALTYWFAAPFLAICALPLCGRALLARRTWRDLGLAALVTSVALVPFTLPLWGRLAGDEFLGSLAATEGALLMQRLNAARPLDLVVPGDLPYARLPVVAVFALGFAATRRGGRGWALVAVAGALLAAGPRVTWDGRDLQLAGHVFTLPLGVLDAIPLMRRFWWPARLLLFSGLAAAGALAFLVARAPERARWPLVAALALALGVEGRHITLSAVAAGNPRLPSGPLDPPTAAPYFAAPIPAWARSSPSAGAVLTLPLRLGPDTPHRPMMYHLGAYHRLPSLVGDGVSNPRLHPPAFAARLASNAVLSAWFRGVPPTDPAGWRALQGLGLRWVLWNLPDPVTRPAEHAAWRDAARALEAQLGPPTSEEPTLLAWDLG